MPENARRKALLDAVNGLWVEHDRICSCQSDESTDECHLAQQIADIHEIVDPYQLPARKAATA